MRFIFLLALTGLFSCSSNTENADKLKATDSTAYKPSEVISVPVDSHQTLAVNGIVPKQPEIPASSVRMNIFKNTETSGFGYDILMGEKLYIHQPNIPALPGNNGFESEEAAKKVAALVIYKIKNNIMPPTVEVKELDSLGIK